MKIIQVDDGADPGKHAAAVRRLILEEHVVAFIGNIAPFTFSAGAADPRGVRRRRPSAARAPTRAWFRSPLAFPINGQTVSRSRPAAKWALANLPAAQGRGALRQRGRRPGRAGRELRRRVAARAAARSSSNAGVSLATPDFTGEVVQAKNSGADIMFVLLEKAACNRFFDAMRRARATRPIIIAPACTLDNALDHKDVTHQQGSTRPHAAEAGARPAAARPRTRSSPPCERFDPSLPPDGAFMFGWLAGKLFQAAMAQPGAVLTPERHHRRAAPPARHRPRRPHAGAGVARRATTPRAAAG